MVTSYTCFHKRSHAPTATDNQFISMEAAKARVLCAKFISFIHKRIQLNSSRTRTRTRTPTRTHVQNPNPKSGSFHPSLQTSMSEIIAATDNFSSDLIVGYSRFGFVYMAELPSGLELAVKKLNPYAFQCFTEFRSELEILGKLRHRNVARILGYCVSGADRILLHELHEEGNLDVHLHCANDMSYPVSPLPWETRCKIVMGVAKGLAYMHDLDKPIIHRDVKSSNVLLDSELEAKISEFGLARIIEHRGSYVSSLAAGTDGYMPPEYVDGSRMATEKGDVYSFGILMLEVATGKRPFSPVRLNGVSKSFLEWTGIMFAQNREREMLDPNIWVSASRRGLEEDNYIIKEYFRIAFMCVDVKPKKRPAMRVVVELLTQNFNLI